MERTEIDAMRHIPLADFLARLGHEPVRRSGNELWYRAPYRNERTPSFRVNVAKQLWYDFGTGKGGDIFTLAGEFIGSNDFMEQVKFIAETANMPMPVPEMSKPTFLPKPSEPAFEGVEATPLFRSPLTDYLAERGIPYGIASRYCCRLNYGARGKRYFAVGFRNMGGGYELRTRFMKWCLPPKDISLIRNGSLTCNLFEGFIDFLSWKVLGISRGEDYLVLNSVSLLERSFPYLDNYGKIRCYLDNDDAGRRTLAVLRKRYGDRIDDCSDLYAGCKDLNEYLESNFPPEQ